MCASALEADDRALADWLRGRKQDDDTAFLLAIDQFEELFTFADPDERGRFDRLLAAALDDADCPLFVISTVRADFLDRFEDLPRLVDVRNRFGKAWTLPPIGGDGLREIIDGPARLAGLDVSEVQEAMVAEARGRAGGAAAGRERAALAVGTTRRTDRLSGPSCSEQGGLAGILSRSADDLLDGLGQAARAGAGAAVPAGQGRPGGPPPHPPAHPAAPRRSPSPAAASAGRRPGRPPRWPARPRRRQGHGPLRLITVTEEAAAA